MKKLTQDIIKIVESPRLIEKSPIMVALEFILALKECDDISLDEYMLILEHFEKVID